PEGLRESDRLPEPLYTPSTKADVGHDEAIDFEQTVELIGDRALAERLRAATLAVYETVAEHALARGIILADTKLEFGLDADGRLTLGDEVCTPDSSRFWPADAYEPGRGQPSFDKQYVRDWAAGTGWDKSPPAPALPEDVGAATRERYVTASERLAGELVLGDEAMTPDSSRFWPADEYEPGRGQRSFDKQYVRDWAAGSGWDKSPPAPAIPDEVVERTRDRYVEAYERLSDEPFGAWVTRTRA
ncbi:MAG TPA: phosphoribosylaminoimidazolesuccinocarboxamide synthase, partial [Solirubrobacteraceae bacterium]|nr:phosphoribosylaminoimidazolesuccinocarboxamide synthase [Solirubrobacteraceae bacterium]